MCVQSGLDLIKSAQTNQFKLYYDGFFSSNL